MKKELSQTRLLELLEYSEETGIFKWKVCRSKVKKGDVAGRASRGYIQIKIDNKAYQAHRLAWMYIHGAFPLKQLDHVNHEKTDNRLNNLREVTQRENSKNQALRKTNTSGVNGISWNKQRNKWGASIATKDGKKHLGLFTVKKDAIVAREKANIRYGFHKNHGVL